MSRSFILYSQGNPSKGGAKSQDAKGSLAGGQNAFLSLSFPLVLGESLLEAPLLSRISRPSQTRLFTIKFGAAAAAVGIKLFNFRGAAGVTLLASENELSYGPPMAAATRKRSSRLAAAAACTPHRSSDVVFVVRAEMLQVRLFVGRRCAARCLTCCAARFCARRSLLPAINFTRARPNPTPGGILWLCLLICSRREPIRAPWLGCRSSFFSQRRHTKANQMIGFALKKSRLWIRFPRNVTVSA